MTKKSCKGSTQSTNIYEDQKCAVKLLYLPKNVLYLFQSRKVLLISSLHYFHTASVVIFTKVLFYLFPKFTFTLTALVYKIYVFVFNIFAFIFSWFITIGFNLSLFITNEKNSYKLNSNLQRDLWNPIKAKSPKAVKSLFPISIWQNIAFPLFLSYECASFVSSEYDSH